MARDTARRVSACAVTEGGHLDPCDCEPWVDCVDCELPILSAEAQELTNGHGPLCQPCWLAYPTEDDPEVRAEIAAQVEAKRQRWTASWEVFDA